MTEEETKTKKAAAKAPAAKKAAAEKPVKEKAAKAESAEAPKAAAKKAAAPKREKKAESGIKKQGKLIADIRLYDVIDRPIVTEKTTLAGEHGKVVFKVAPTATKAQVKEAVEALFGVKVTKVNTIVQKGKTKRFRGRAGVRSDVRKAIVTLAPGQSIDVAAGLR